MRRTGEKVKGEERSGRKGEAFKEVVEEKGKRQERKTCPFLKVHVSLFLITRAKNIKCPAS